MENEMLLQRTPEWYKARLGKITSSMCFNCMSLSSEEKAWEKAQETGKKKTESEEDYMKRMEDLRIAAEKEPFSDTARTYFFQLAAERSIMNSVIEDEYRFSEYLQRVDITTRDMRYGTETEELARVMYGNTLESRYSIVTGGFYEHPTIKNYGDSPDGVVMDSDTFSPAWCIEIKCPKPGTFVKYSRQMRELMSGGMRAGEALKEVEPKYYWQCVSHMICSGTKRCDFILFDKMLERGLSVYPVALDTEDARQLVSRIELADSFIGSCCGWAGYDISDVDKYDGTICAQ